MKYPNCEQISEYKNITYILLGEKGQHLSDKERTKLEKRANELDKLFPKICILAANNTHAI